jgi:hypothetical protein
MAPRKQAIPEAPHKIPIHMAGPSSQHSKHGGFVSKARKVLFADKK